MEKEEKTQRHGKKNNFKYFTTFKGQGGAMKRQL